MGAIGIALLALKNANGKTYSLDIKNTEFETIGKDCEKCPNNCEIIKVYKDKTLIDTYGNKCEKGLEN